MIAPGMLHTRPVLLSTPMCLALQQKTQHTIRLLSLPNCFKFEITQKKVKTTAVELTRDKLGTGVKLATPT